MPESPSDQGAFKTSATPPACVCPHKTKSAVGDRPWKQTNAQIPSSPENFSGMFCQTRPPIAPDHNPHASAAPMRPPPPRSRWRSLWPLTSSGFRHWFYCYQPFPFCRAAVLGLTGLDELLKQRVRGPTPLGSAQHTGCGPHHPRAGGQGA